MTDNSNGILAAYKGTFETLAHSTGMENTILTNMHAGAGVLMFGKAVEVTLYTTTNVCVYNGVTERPQLSSNVYVVQTGNTIQKLIVP